MGKRERDIEKYNYELRKRLYKTIASKFVIMLSWTFDAFFIVLLFGVFFYYILQIAFLESYVGLLSVIGIMIIAFLEIKLGKVMFNNRTFGQVLTGIHYVDIGSMRPVDKVQEKRVKIGAFDEYYYTETYTFFHFLGSELNQTRIMERIGYICVRSKEYNLFAMDYLDGEVLFEELKMSPSLIDRSQEQIFKD